jgi:hypothetical protein
MKTNRFLLAALLALLAVPSSQTQEKPAATAAARDVAPPAVAYRMQVVLEEYDGTKKVSSMPYTIPVATPVVGDMLRQRGSLRVGVRVPILVGGKNGENELQYVDIGSNIDVQVRSVDAERYALELTIDRSSIYARQRDNDGKEQVREWAPGDEKPSTQPLIHNFRSNVSLLVRDSRPGEALVATDPITGHVLRVEATLTLLK